MRPLDLVFLATLLSVTHAWNDSPRLAHTPAIALARATAARSMAQARHAEASRAGSPTSPETPTLIRTRTGKRLLLPRGCDTVRGNYDVLVHFHGAPTAVEPAFLAADLDAVLVLENLGPGSGRYERKYGEPQALENLVRNTTELLANRCAAPGTRVRRVALSAWSAGYGAILHILEREAGRVDAVLLADGLHGRLLDRRTRQVDPRVFATLTRFAEDARAGDKLLAITYSAVRTTTYASTTETAEHILTELRLSPTPVRELGPREDMWRTTQTTSGSLSVEGYSGADAAAHSDHLLAIGETLFPRLQARWQDPSNRAPASPTSSPRGGRPESSPSVASTR